MLPRSLLCSMFLLAVIVDSRELRGDEPRSISVIGDGAATAPPNFVLVKGRLEQQGETAPAALEEFSKAKSSLEKLFADMPKVTVEFRGEQLSQGGDDIAGMMVDADGEEVGVFTGEYAVVEPVAFRLEIASEMERTQIATELAKIAARAAEAGVIFSPRANELGVQRSLSFVEFAVRDPQAVEEKAAQSAMKKARQRAQRLASLAGGRLGAVLSVRELGPEDEGDQASVDAMMEMYGVGDEMLERYSVDSNRQYEARQRLRVVFALEEAEETPASADSADPTDR